VRAEPERVADESADDAAGARSAVVEVEFMVPVLFRGEPIVCVRRLRCDFVFGDVFNG